MRVLIIDDEPHIRHMMRLTLEAAAHEVDEAATGEDGLARFKDGAGWDVVLVDQKMPGMDGLETLKRLKSRRPDARVVMVTAFASVALAVDAMKLGATDFLRKPMTPDMLRGAVSAAGAGRLAAAPPSPAAPNGQKMPLIQTLTLNGYRILPDESTRVTRGEHAFLITRFPGGGETTVVVTIDDEAVARVDRLTHRRLRPDGSFWRAQAERRLSDYVWLEGRIPESGRLTVEEIARDDLDVAGAWEGD
jgi:CheY-like chemotaxis protein